MRGLGEWLRADPRRFAWVVMMLSVFGLVWVVLGGLAGGDSGTTVAGTLFSLLIVISFVYGRGLE